MVLHLALIYSGLFQKKAILGARTKMEICIVLQSEHKLSRIREKNIFQMVAASHKF